MAGPCQTAASGCVGRSLYYVSKYEPVAAHPQRRSPPLRCCHFGAAVQDSAKRAKKSALST